MRKKLTLQIDTEEPKILVIEPYGYERGVAAGDVIEITYVPEETGDTIQINHTHITLWCFEPEMTINGEPDVAL